MIWCEELQKLSSSEITRICRLAAFLDEFKVDLSNLHNRKLAKNLVVLAQLFGINLGYEFYWYMHAPACAELVRDLMILDDGRKEVD